MRESNNLNSLKLTVSNMWQRFLDQIGLPQCYKLILLYFLELKESPLNQSGREQILFNNKDILIHGHGTFYRNWFDWGIYLVHDLLRADGKFLCYSEFIQKYDLWCNVLIWFQVVSAIPRHLTESARENPTDWSDLLLNSVFQLSAEISIHLTKMRNRDYYRLLIKLTRTNWTEGEF